MAPFFLLEIEMEPIERVEAALESHGLEVEEVLVPEGCLVVVIDGVLYHVTISPMK